MGLRRALVVIVTIFVSCSSLGETTSNRPTNVSGESSDCPIENPNSVAHQCAMGVYQNIVGLLSLPGNLVQLVGRGQQNLRECNSNPARKRGLLIVIEPMIDVNQWMSMTCEQIISSLNLQERNFLRQVQRKKNELERYRNLLAASSLDPTRQEFLRERIARVELSDNEQAFIERYAARENLVRRLSGSDIINGITCTSFREILVTTCEVIVEAATGGLAARVAKPAIKGLQNSAGTLGARASAFRAVADSFQNSPLVEFYTAGGRVENLSINPGDTFTVILRNDRIILGRNIPGSNGRPGGPESHRTLMGLMGEENTYGYYGRGGAVRFNENGSIDISGYHLEDDAEPRAYRNIQTIMQRVNPDAVYRATPDRLSTLPSQ